MEIRKYQEKDRLSLIELWKTIFPNNPPHSQPENNLTAKLAVDDLIFVAQENDKLIGACMAGYDGHRGWLYAVAVRPEHRRKGIGSQLVQHAIQALKERGCVKVNLQIRPANTQVAAFYQSVGFAIEDRMSMGLLLNKILNDHSAGFSL